MWEITNISGQILNHDLNSQASEFVTMDKLVNPSRKLGDTHYCKPTIIPLLYQNRLWEWL